jgi:hypothetical protein
MKTTLLIASLFLGAGAPLPRANSTRPTPAPQAEELSAMRTRYAELEAQLDRNELEHEMARVERERSMRSEWRQRRRDLERGMQEIEDRMDQLDREGERLEEDHEQRWELLESRFDRERCALEEDADAEIERAGLAHENEYRAQRLAQGELEDEELEVFERRAELEWNERERGMRRQCEQRLIEIEEQGREELASLRLEFRQDQDEMRQQRRLLERDYHALEAQAEDLEEEVETDLELADLREQAVALEQESALEAELESLGYAIEELECAEFMELDEDGDDESSEDVIDFKDDELPEDVVELLEGRDLKSLFVMVAGLRRDVDQLRHEVDQLWEVVGRREGATEREHGVR